MSVCNCTCRRRLRKRKRTEFHLQLTKRSDRMLLAVIYASQALRVDWRRLELHYDCCGHSMGDALSRFLGERSLVSTRQLGWLGSIRGGYTGTPRLACMHFQWRFVGERVHLMPRVLPCLLPTPLQTAAFPPIPLNIDSLINADYVAATILISFGAVIGRVSATQMLVMALIEVVGATANVVIGMELAVTDPGGSMLIHCYGAAFGLVS